MRHWQTPNALTIRWRKQIVMPQQNKWLTCMGRYINTSSV